MLKVGSFMGGGRMKYRHEILATSDKSGNCHLAFGEASWDKQTPVVKLGWHDKNGHRSRPGGEIWMAALLQTVTEATRLGYITPKEGVQAVLDGMP
jgi:hypothetical protein